MDKSIIKKIILLPLLILVIPSASAYSNPIETLFVGISNFFNMNIFANSEAQLGFLRFMLWLALFAILFWSGSKFVFKEEKGNRTAGVVAAIMSLISVIFMPESAVLGIGTAYSATIFVILTVGIAGFATFIAFKKLKNEWWEHILGILILIFAAMILNVVYTIMAAV